MYLTYDYTKYSLELRRCEDNRVNKITMMQQRSTEQHFNC